MREFCESIAFYGGQEKERETADASFAHALEWGLILIWKMFPSFLMNGVAVYAGDLVAYGAVSLLVFSTGKIAGHPVSEGSIVTFATLLATFAAAINTVRRLFLLRTVDGTSRSCAQLGTYVTAFATTAGYAHRVGHMMDTVDRMK